MRIEDFGDNALIDCGDVSYTFEVVENPRTLDQYRVKEDSLQWDNDNFHVGGYRVHPYGDANDLPEQIRLIVQNHYLASGQLKKKTQMLWGQGPKLYRERIKDGVLTKEWVYDKDVWNWINSFDGESYLLNCCTDFHHIEGTFTKFYRARGGRIGRNRIAKLEHVSPGKARLASPYAEYRKEPTHIVLTDWAFNHINSITDFAAYKIFDFKKPFAEKNAIMYSNMYSFCTDYYTVPDLYGSMEWLRRSTAIPMIFKALSKNSMNIKYHIQSPADFWKAKKEDLMDQCSREGREFKEKMFKEYKSAFLKKVTDVLSGVENTGKFLHTEKVLNVDGHNLIEQGWEIKTIDQNIKDFVAAHINISDKSDRVISAALGLHGALGNVSSDGKKDSGSEQVYAFKNYLNSGVDIPEMVVCKPINYAIKANFPEKDLKIGFYHAPVKSEEETAPKDRIKNN